MTYRAQWDGEFLLVRGTIQPGWHTFVMDNKERQQERLKGKPSLGIEKSTEVTVVDGLTSHRALDAVSAQRLSKPEISLVYLGLRKRCRVRGESPAEGSGSCARRSTWTSVRG